MILAAGEGTRLRPLTYTLPKPMIPILGKPVMEHLIEQLARHGFNHIMVNTSYLPRSIEDYFADGRHWNVRIGYSFEGRVEGGKIVSEPLGSAGGIRKIQDESGFFDDTFMVICGDIMFDADLTVALRKHWQSGAAASLLVCEVPRERVSNYGVVVCDDDGRISSFQEKPATDEALSNLVNAGIYIFEPGVIDLAPPGAAFDIGSELFPAMLAQGLPLHAIRMPFNWMDIGRPGDYWEVSQALMRRHAARDQMPGEEVYPQVWAGLNTAIDWRRVHIEGPVYIGSSTRIEAGCEILGPTWIGRGCHLGGGVTLHHSILFDHTRIRTGSKLRDMVVLGRNCVDKNGNSPPDGAAIGVEDARA